MMASNASCALFNFSQFKQNSGLKKDKFPNALKHIGIASPKNPVRNGWLSNHNGCPGILLPCSNGFTAPVVRVNGFSSVSDHADACCRMSSRRRLQAGRVRHFNVSKIVKDKEIGDAEGILTSSTSLEVLDERALQASNSPDLVSGSRSERAFNAELPSSICLTTHCQQTQDFRKFSVLCKEKASSSSSSSLSSISGHSSITGIKREKAKCQWNDCGKDMEVDVLLEHIARSHVDCQVQENAEGSKYVCLWNGCKFYNRSSVLKTWLERHILCHLGNKPYRCIVAHCHLRFASQFLLNRHINRHFSGLQSRPMRKGDTQQKKKKLKCTRPCLVKTDDFFDSVTMESIQNELVRCAEITQVNQVHSGNSVTFRSYTVAKRIDSSGHQETLLRWWPKNMLPDEWVPESQVASYTTRVIPLSKLSTDALQLLVTPLRPHHLVCHTRGKNHRK